MYLSLEKIFWRSSDPFKNILPEKLRPHFRLEQLRKKQAILAIRGPLKMIDNLPKENANEIEFSDKWDMVNQLLKTHEEIQNTGLRQLEGEFVEPIQLQVVCRRWWQEREGFQAPRIEERQFEPSR